MLGFKHTSTLRSVLVHKRRSQDLVVRTVHDQIKVSTDTNDYSYVPTYEYGTSAPPKKGPGRSPITNTRGALQGLLVGAMAGADAGRFAMCERGTWEATRAAGPLPIHCRQLGEWSTNVYVLPVQSGIHTCTKQHRGVRAPHPYRAQRTPPYLVDSPATTIPT